MKDTVSSCVGLIATGVILSFVLSRSMADVAKEELDWHKSIAYAVIHPVFSVGIGWIIVQFM